MSASTAHAASARPYARAPAVVTGAGVVALCGTGDDFWRAFALAPRVPPPSPASRRGAPVPPRAASLEAAGFDAEAYLDARELRRLGRYSIYALVAGRLAARGRGDGNGTRGSGSEERRDRALGAAVLGTTYGSSDYHFEYYEGLFEHGLKEASPVLFSESVINAAAGHLCRSLALEGPGLALVGAEDAGLQALATALDLLRLGRAEYAFAGGTEEYCDLVHAALGRAGAVGSTNGEPFGAAPAPCAYGEGAAVLVVETVESAALRRARPLALLSGASSARRRSADAPHAAVARAIREALEDAGTAAEEVDLIVSGARGVAADTVELAGLTAVLDRERPRCVVTPKRWTGEGFAFSSAAQAALAALAIDAQDVPTAALATAERLPAAWRTLAAAPVGIRAALVLSTSEAGAATALVLLRP